MMKIVQKTSIKAATLTIATAALVTVASTQASFAGYYRNTPGDINRYSVGKYTGLGSVYYDKTYGTRYIINRIKPEPTSINPTPVPKYKKKSK